MRKGRRKLNQAGMTLIELIVVILIIGILSAGAVAGVSYVNRMDASNTGEKLVSLLDRTRVYTISANGTVTLELKKEGNTYYGTLKNDGTVVDKVSLGSGNLKIKATKTVTSGGVSVDQTLNINSVTAYVISYKKDNGAFAEAYKQIKIEGSKTRYIQMVHTTGRSYLK